LSRAVHPECVHLGRIALKREVPEGINKTDRARWGASGALLPTIRYSGIEFPVEAVLFLDSVRVSGVEGLGPAQRALCESRQDREVAAVVEKPLVLQVSLA
jgi:hypothetical protein